MAAPIRTVTRRNRHTKIIMSMARPGGEVLCPVGAAAAGAAPLVRAPVPPRRRTPPSVPRRASTRQFEGRIARPPGGDGRATLGKRRSSKQVSGFGEVPWLFRRENSKTKKDQWQLQTKSEQAAAN